MVAKSFQNLEQIGEPFEEGGKMYVNVRAKNGKEKRVRWYSIDEYCRMYPEANREELLRKYDPYWKLLKHILMGDGEFIYILEGDVETHLQELQNCKDLFYCTWWGWYLKSTAPQEIVDGAREWFTLHRIEWSDVGASDIELKPYPEVKKFIDTICNGKAAYKWQ